PRLGSIACATRLRNSVGAGSSTFASGSHSRAALRLSLLGSLSQTIASSMLFGRVEAVLGCSLGCSFVSSLGCSLGCSFGCSLGCSFGGGTSAVSVFLGGGSLG